MTRFNSRGLAAIAGCLVLLGALAALLLSHRRVERKDPDAVLGVLLSQYPMPVSVSPDGSRILAKSRHVSDFELLVRDRASGAVLHTTRSPDTQLSLTWRPDGGAIAFVSSAAGNRQYRLSLWDLTRGELKTFDSPLTLTAAPPIRWAPDGRSLLLFVGDGRAGEVRMLKVGSENTLESVWQARVTTEADYCWSADGSKVTYIPAENPSSILQAEVGSSRAPELLAQLPAGSLVRDLSWSADGRSLLFSAREPGEEFFNPRRLEPGTRQPSQLVRKPLDVRHPVWMKDQRHFLYEANADGVQQLWLASVDGGSDRMLGRPDESHAVLGLSDQGDQVYSYRTRLDAPPDLVSLALSSADLRILAASPKQPEGIRPRVLKVRSYDGLEVPVIIWGDTSPRPDAKLRAVINVHGGPHLQELPMWDARTQYLLSQGLVVASVNYRGSKGYGAAFEKHEDTAGQAQDLLAVQRYLTDELGVPTENISLLASSTGTRVAVHAAFLGPEHFDRLILTSTVRLDPRTCPKQSASRHVLAFHGLGDNVLSPSAARTALGRCFGEASFSSGASQLEVFDDEGHQFHRSRSWARVLSSLE